MQDTSVAYIRKILGRCLRTLRTMHEVELSGKQICERTANEKKNPRYGRRLGTS